MVALALAPCVKGLPANISSCNQPPLSYTKRRRGGQRSNLSLFLIVFRCFFLFSQPLCFTLAFNVLQLWSPKCCHGHGSKDLGVPAHEPRASAPTFHRHLHQNRRCKITAHVNVQPQGNHRCLLLPRTGLVIIVVFVIKCVGFSSGILDEQFLAVHQQPC